MDFTLPEWVRGEFARLDKLSKTTRLLLVSFLFYYIADPLLFVFSNAYIWRNSSRIEFLAFYNLTFFVVIALTFYLNGLLLKSFNVGHIYAFGLAAQGPAIASLMLVKQLSLLSLCTAAAALGFAAGLYWANRNLLTLCMTKDEERNYFASMEASMQIVLAVIMPFIFGWFIQLSEATHILEGKTSYRVLIIFIMLVLFAGGRLILKADFETYTPKYIFLPHTPSHWSWGRVFMLLQGLADGVSLFLTTLIILYLVGKEGALGSLQSLSTLLSATLVYFMGRFNAPDDRVKILSIGIALCIIGSIVFGISYSAGGAITLAVFHTLGAPLIWVAGNPIIMRAIDHNNQDKIYHYAYVADRELFLNIGRGIGILIFLCIFAAISAESSIRYIPLFLALTQVALIKVAKQLSV